jgi:parallel beta-helix repeat protein
MKSYPGEKAVISGSVPLNLKWSRYKDGIWKASVKKDLIFDQLFVNGRLQRMARYPNFDPEATFLGGTASDAISRDRTANYADPEGAYVHALHIAEWGDFHYLVKGRNEAGELILEGGWQNNRRMGMHKNYRFIENVFEELDTVGEWFFNKTTKTLFYYPDQNEDLNSAIIEVPQITSLIEVRGSEKNPVRNIHIDSLELTQTLRTFMDNKEQLLRSDWTTFRGGAIFMEGAENCRVSGCYFNHTGGNGIYFSNYNRNNQVTGCHFSFSGASAVSFVGDPGAVRSPSFEYNEFVAYDSLDLIPGPKTNNFPAACRVYNNLIHNSGFIEKQSAGVQISMSREITVSHNTIYDVPRAGININDGTWGGHLIEFNDVFNTVLETGDHGSFNSWGRDRYWHPDRRIMDSLASAHPELILLDAVKTTTIRNNRFRCDHGWDIDLDDGSSNYEIYNNLCLNGGIKLREGFFRMVYNNIMINNSFHPHVWFRNSRDVFMHNIVTAPYAPIRVPFWGKFVNHNFFTDSMALGKAQSHTIDQNSIFGDPLFVNPDKGDYRVAVNSPALLSGFTNFEMDAFGVVSAHLKSLSGKVILPLPVISTKKQKEAETEILFGILVKNITTPGELSATGMSSESGILVVEVQDSSQFAGIVRPNDVILSFDGKQVSKVSDLRILTRTNTRNKVIEVKVFRDQKVHILKVDPKY